MAFANRKLKSLGLVPVACSSSVTAVSLTLPTGKLNDEIEYIQINVEGANIRWRADGVTPVSGASASASSGALLSNGDYLFYDGQPSQFQFILQTGTTTAVCHAEFFAA